MSYQISEQVIHDRVNLFRLVRRLEKTVANEDWNDESLPPRATWIKTQGTLQKLKHARKLLNNVEIHENNREAFQRFEVLKKTIERLENAVKEVDKRVAPKSQRPAPILPTIPPPVFPVSVPGPTSQQDVLLGASIDAAAEPVSVEETATIATQDLLLSPSDTDPTLRTGLINPSSTLLPPNIPSSPAKSTATGTPAFLQNSAALQEELSAQLAQMATQLKRNALHFSNSLEKDKAVVLETQEKLERNHDIMKRERMRVRDHRSKSWGTTWLVILSMMVALVGFILTFFVIRIT